MDMQNNLDCQKRPILSCQFRKKYQILSFSFLDSQVKKNSTCSVNSIYDGYILENSIWSYALCYQMCSHPFRGSSDDGIPLFRWVVLIANYNRISHYNYKQNGWDCQPSTLHCIPCVKISGTIFSILRFASDGQFDDFHSRCAQYLQPIFDRETQGDGGKKDLNPILCRSVYFTDHSQTGVDQHFHSWDTVYTHGTKRKPDSLLQQMFYTGSHKQTHYTNTSHTRKLREQ